MRVLEDGSPAGDILCFWINRNPARQKDDPPSATTSQQVQAGSLDHVFSTKAFRKLYTEKKRVVEQADIACLQFVARLRITSITCSPTRPLQKRGVLPTSVAGSECRMDHPLSIDGRTSSKKTVSSAGALQVAQQKSTFLTRFSFLFLPPYLSRKMEVLAPARSARALKHPSRDPIYLPLSHNELGK